MGTQGVILESLRVKRKATVNETDITNRKPRLALQTIRERKIRFIKESTFKGMDEMPKGKLKSSVIIAYDNGDNYVGQIKDRLPDGQGTIASKDGDMYTGSFQNGIPHGWGSYIWADGCIYSGYWKNGMRHGQGVFYEDGEEIYGEWENGRLVRTEGPICDKTANKGNKKSA